MGEIVDVIEEIKARLAKGITAGQPLEDVKRIQIGSRETARKLNDYPIINISIPSAEETFQGTTRLANDKLTLEITLIVNKKDSHDNVLYDALDSTGSIYLFEKMRNVIDKNTSGTVDLDYNSTVYNTRKITWRLIEDQENLIEIEMTMELETNIFSIGSL